jgi:hypothetical protein
MASLTPQASSTPRLLKRAQAIREKRSNRGRKPTTAARTERCALNQTAEALHGAATWGLREVAEPTPHQLHHGSVAVALRRHYALQPTASQQPPGERA